MKFKEHYISSKPWSWVLGATALTLVLIGTLVTPAAASWYGHPDTGMAFVTEGDKAFADRVVSFMPQFDVPVTGPAAAFLNSADALGPTNYTGLHGTPGHYYYNTGEFVSLGTDGLGNGGVLILEFTDNHLRLNGNSGPDIFVFEVGAIVETMDVAVSEDGSTWFPVGSIQYVAGKNIRTVDLDAYAGTYGWDLTNEFYFIRLTDDGSPQGGAWSGADIDAVAGIPEPGAFILIAVGAVATVIRRRRL